MATDFIAQHCSITEKYLKQRRKIVNGMQSSNERIAEDAAVVMVALDGAKDHKRYHPNFNPFHYIGFTERCRTIMKKNGGIVLESKDDGIVDFVVVGWFPGDGVKAIIAMAEVRESLLTDIGTYQPPWMHERHHIAAIGQNEYAAAHLLQLARRDVTIVDPKIYDRLNAENEAFVELAKTSQVMLPNYQPALDDIDQMVELNVEQFRRLWDRSQSEQSILNPVRAAAMIMS